MWVGSTTMDYVNCILHSPLNPKAYTLRLVLVGGHLGIWVELYSWHYSQ